MSYDTSIGFVWGIAFTLAVGHLARWVRDALLRLAEKEGE